MQKNSKNRNKNIPKEISSQNEQNSTATQIVKPKIFNLSHKALSRYQISILLRGLKFTPTPKRNDNLRKSNIQNYMRESRLAEFFQEKETNNSERNLSEKNLFKEQSTFTPPRNRDKDLDHQIDVLNNLNLEKMETRYKNNLSKKEQTELLKLQTDKTIVVKPADKGGAVVILSTGHYQDMIMTHLNDDQTYKQLDFCIDKKIQSNLQKLLGQYKMCFTEPEWKFLNNKYHEVSNFYGLPKIHKSKLIESAIITQNSEVINIFEPNDLKVRPIVGGPKCPTRRLSKLLDILLKPILKHIKSYIRDSVDFLNKCPREVDENTEIVTFDVVSLYTSIPHDFGLQALDYFLTTYEKDLHPRFKKQFVLESANFVLKNNTMNFDSKFYLQIKGTAMGTIFAPTYANLTMGYHEVQLYSIIYQNYRLASDYFTNSWFRFLDDCQILLKVDLINPDNLLNILNKININIQFTMEKSQNRLPFLDIMINKDGTKIWMDIYNKPTDAKRYVPFTSNHPRHCLTNIPFSLARRISTIVEKENIKNQRFTELKHLLLEQKYPITLIEAGIEKAKQIPLQILRQPKSKNNEEIIPFITTYNPNNPNIFPIIKQSFNNFQYSKTMSNIFHKKKLVNSMSQAPNLGRLLCRSDFQSQHKQHEVKTCGKNCVCCPYLLNASTYIFKKVHKTFYLKTSFNCESNNLIYVVICSGCKEEYIGETGCLVKERINIYRQHIRQPQYQQLPVEGHLRTCGDGMFHMFPFFKIRENNKTLRKSYEDYFIDKFKPSLNKKI